MKLYLKSFVKEEFNVNSRKDFRNAVNRLTVGYENSELELYRRQFEFPPDLTHDTMQENIPLELFKDNLGMLPGKFGEWFRLF